MVVRMRACDKQFVYICCEIAILILDIKGNLLRIGFDFAANTFCLIDLLHF